MTDNTPYAPPAAQLSPVPDERPTTPAQLLVRLISPVLLGLMAIACVRSPSGLALPGAFLCIVLAMGLACGEVWAKYLWYAMAGVLSLVLLAMIGYWIRQLSLSGVRWSGMLLPVLPALFFIALFVGGVTSTRLAYARMEGRKPAATR